MSWLALIIPFSAKPQTLGGKSAYNFLKLPSSPLLAAVGGVNVSYQASDVGLTANNPALLHPSVSKQVSLSFNSAVAGTKAYQLTGAFYASRTQTVFGGHLSYYDYGSLPNTDAAGNVMGSFRPVDFVVQVSAARTYLQHWTYGLTLKFIQSSYGQYKSNAAAVDAGLHYADTANGISAAILVKNMGGQLSAYAGETEELPFDLQVGLTKRLQNSPFGFSLAAQHLQRFDIFYNDTLFNRDNGISSSASGVQKLLTHVVLASHIYLGNQVEASVGYNFLRRQQLTTGAGGDGLTGFSAGLRLRLTKLQVYYARAAYQRGVASNQIGLLLHLDRFFGW